MDGWMDGWSDGQAEADSLERQKHELLELLGDVPLIAATTVAVSQLAARRMASPSVGEKGYLPLNTLNKMNRKRAQKGEREREREREREEKRRGEKRREEETASSDVQCGTRAALALVFRRIFCQFGPGDAQCLAGKGRQRRAETAQ